MVKWDRRALEQVLVLIFMFVLFVFASAAPPSLSGIVAQFNNTPISGMNVSLYNATNGAMISSNLTDANGTYFVDLTAGGTYYAIFNMTGFIYGSNQYRNITVTVGGSENKVVNTSMYPDNHGSYNITVSDIANGSPVENVNVTIFASTGDVSYGMTDIAGNAFFQIIANNSGFNVTHNISLIKPGYKQRILTDLVVNEGFNVDNVSYLDGFRNISGLVTQFNDSAIMGLNVSVHNLSTGVIVASNLTDSAGNYFIDLPSWGSFFVIFNKSSEYVYGGNNYLNISVAVASDEAKILDASMYPNNHGSYNVTVSDIASGSPVESVNVTVFASTGDVSYGMTDAAGNAFLQIIANNSDFNVTHNISLSKAGYKPQILTGRAINEGYNLYESLSLDVWRNISGKVTRYNGDPIYGMNVSVYNLSTGRIVASNLTGQSGYYFIDLNTWGSFYLIFNGTVSGQNAYIYGTNTYRNFTTTVSAGEAAILNTSFYLKGFGSYNITTRDVWNGRPIQNANVTIFYSGTFNKTGYTDEKGNVLIEVVANTTSNAGVLHDIRVNAFGYNSTYRLSESILEGMNKNIFVNQTGTCEVYGNVTDSENNLIAPMINGAYLELWSYLNTYRVGWGGSYYYSTYTDADGRYYINYPSTLTGTLNCNAYLRVNASGYVSKSVPVVSSAIKNLNLTGGAFVMGRVFDGGNTSQRISGALVRIISDGSVMHQVLTDSSGSFNVSIRDGINHTLEVSHVGYGVYANSTAYTSSVDYGNIFLSGLGEVNGTVVDEANNSIVLSGVNVKVVGGNVTYNMTTDSYGRFGMIVRDDVLYNFSFDLNGYFSNYTLYQVSGENDVGAVSLRGKNRVHGLVSDSLNLHDAYVEGVKVELISRVDLKRYTAYTDAEGVYSFYASSMINDYLMRFDKPGYNLSQANYSLVNNAEINANLKGATHVGGVVTDVYSSIVAPLSSVLVEVTDSNGTVYYSTHSGYNGNYSLDLGVDFVYNIRASLSGYQNAMVANLTWDQDRTGTGGTDRVQDISMNGSVRIYVKTIDAFDNMNVDNSMVCVFFNASSESCLYIETTGLDGDVSFNIRGGSDYRMKVTRDGYIQQILPENGGVMSGDNSSLIALEAYAELYLYDKYALNNEQIRGAYVELYTYNNETSYNYNIAETRVNVSVVCNGLQSDDINVSLIGFTNSYYSSLNTSSGSSLVYFRKVPVGTYTLRIDGIAVDCGYYEGNVSVGTGGLSYLQTYNTDTIPPLIFNLTESADPIELGSSVTVTVSANDSQNTVGIVLIDVNGTNRTMNKISSDTYQYSWTPAAARAEIYRIYAADTWNNVNMTVANITVIDTTAPVVTLIVPNNISSYVGNVTFNYSVADLSPISRCELWTNTTGVWAFNMTNTTVVERSATNSIDLNNIADGNYIWNVNCTDTSGNHNFSSMDYVFAVDATVPVLTIQNPENKSYGASVIPFNVSSNKPLVWAYYSLDSQANVTMYNNTLTEFYRIPSIPDGSHSVVYYGLTYNGRIGSAGPRVFTVDTLKPTVSERSPANGSLLVEPAFVNFTLNATELVNLSVAYWSNSTLWTGTNTSFSSRPIVTSVSLANDTYHWNYTICDPAGNCMSSGNFPFNVTPAPVDLTVYVNDTLGSLVGADDNGNGASVRIYNQTYSLTKNTTSFGYVVFDNLVDGSIYNISVNGTRQGYGLNNAIYGPIFGDSGTSVVVNMTKLLVNVTNEFFVAMGDSNVTVYLSDNITIAKNATGGDLSVLSDANGIATFNRVLPCADCNVTVRKSFGPVIMNSTRVNITAGNSSNYVWIDPPLSMGDTFNLNFTLSSELVPTNVTISIRDYNSTVIRWSNRTGPGGNAVIYNVPTGIYDFIVNGEDVGYGRTTYYHNIVGVVIQNSGTTDVGGRTKINVNGLLTYYVSVNANGYDLYDDLTDGVPRVGTYDDSSNSLGIKPMVRLGLSGNTTLEGYVNDVNFMGPINLSYEPVSNAVLKMYAKTSCDAIPSETLLRYMTVSSANGTYSLVVSPAMHDDPSSPQDYCFNVSAIGFVDKHENDVDVAEVNNIGLTGDGTISGVVKVHNSSLAVSNAFILLRSHECYGGDIVNENCGAYSGTTDSNGYFSFNANSRTSGLGYAPYTMRVEAQGYHILDNVTIAGLPATGDNLSLVPAQLSFIRISVVSDYDEQISRNVSIKLIQNIGGSGTLVIDKTECDVYYNEYSCVVDTANLSDYDILVNGTEQGYGSYIEQHIIPTPAEPVLRNIVLNVTKVNITLLDENGIVISQANVTLGSVPPVTKAIVNGSAVFYPVLEGSYSLAFEGLLDYLSVSNSTIDVVNVGGMNSRILYANETQFYVNISNGTAGLENISVGIGSLLNATNATGEILFGKVNNSISGSYGLEFNRTDLYLRGYFAPNISVNVMPGLDRETGNNVSVVLNKTSGYGVFRVNTGMSGVNASVWYNLTDIVEYRLSAGDNISFLKTNVTLYNESLYIRAEKTGYVTEIAGPYNTSDGNVTYVDIAMVLEYSNCSNGAIASTCYCGLNTYSSGYCCSGSYQAGSCGGSGSSSGGGSGSSGGGSRSGSFVFSNKTGDVKQNKTIGSFDLDLNFEPESVLNVVDGKGCTNVPLTVKNTGDLDISGLVLEVSGLQDRFETSHGSLPTVLSRGANVTITIAICSVNVTEAGVYGYTLSVHNDDIMKSATLALNILSVSDDIAARIKARLAKIGSILFDIDVSKLSPELKGYYDIATKSHGDAQDYLDKGDYDKASSSLDDAEKYVQMVLDGLKPITEKPSEMSLYIMGGVLLLAVIGAAFAYVLFLRRKAVYQQAHSNISGKPLESSLGLQRVSVPAVNASKKLLQVLGVHDVYYTHSLSKRKYLTDLVETVLAVKCPKCGGKVFMNRCVWCGFMVDSLGMNSKRTLNVKVNGGLNREQDHAYKDKGDAYYTHRSDKQGGKGDRFVTSAALHVVEDVCPKCKGRVFNGKCVWCK